MTKPVYTYEAKIIKVVDGDTVDAELQLGFDVMVRTRFRLYGIDTAEKTSSNIETKNLAIAATEFTKQYIGKSITIESLGKDKYGRWLAKIHTADGILNEQLINNNLAKPYFGDSKQNLGWKP
jgi:micrococcal nuclease